MSIFAGCCMALLFTLAAVSAISTWNLKVEGKIDDAAWGILITAALVVGAVLGFFVAWGWRT